MQATGPAVVGFGLRVACEALGRSNGSHHSEDVAAMTTRSPGSIAPGPPLRLNTNTTMHVLDSAVMGIAWPIPSKIRVSRRAHQVLDDFQIVHVCSC